MFFYYRVIHGFTLHYRVIWGRSHIKTVAEARKREIETFLQDLLKKAPEICEVD